MAAAAAFAVAAAAISASGQDPAARALTGTDSGLRVVLTSPGPASASALPPGRLIRVIEDPNLGDRWLLCRNVEHPGGPGRLLLVTAVRSGTEGNQMPGGPLADGRRGYLAPLHPVIHAGDWLVVEESSTVAEARLRAVALESATEGSALNVRLEIGGKVVRVVALGAGRAVFQPETEVRR